MKATRRRSHGKRKKKVLTIRKNLVEKMEKKVATRSLNMMKPIHTKRIMMLPRNLKKESMDTRSSTRRDQRPLAITRRPTRMNTIKHTNSTMISMKKANIR